MIQIRPMAPTGEDLERLKVLFDRNESPKELAHLRWRYLDNPTGELFVDLAEDSDGTTAGSYCVSPMSFQVDGRRVLGVQSIDTMTDAGYRGQGLFKRLAARTYARCAEAGASLVYGFPNHRSQFGFFERLGWTRMDPVPFLIRPIRLGYALRRVPGWPELSGRLDPALFAGPPELPPRQEMRVVLGFDESFDRLWDAFSRDIPVALRRDAPYLAWRFGANPAARYKCHGLYEDGELVGYVITHVVDKHGGRVGYVMELIHRPGRADDGERLARQAVHEIGLAGGEVALAWCLDHSPNAAAYRAAGFRGLPERLRPIQLHFGARHLAASDSPICNRRSWYLSYCDSDTV